MKYDFIISGTLAAYDGEDAKDYVDAIVRVARQEFTEVEFTVIDVRDAD